MNLPTITLGLAVLTLATVDTAPRWTATLNPVGGSRIAGRATLEAVGQDSALATLQITGAAPGQKLSWAVSQGSCQAKGKGLRSADFPVITAGPDGRAASTARLHAAPTSGAALLVTVSEAAGSDDALACGMLKPEGGTQADSSMSR